MNKSTFISTHGFTQDAFDFTYVFPITQDPIIGLQFDLMHIQDYSGGDEFICLTVDPFPRKNADQLSTVNGRILNQVWMQMNPVPDNQNQIASLPFFYPNFVQLKTINLRLMSSGSTPIVAGPTFKAVWRLTLFYDCK